MEPACSFYGFFVHIAWPGGSGFCRFFSVFQVCNFSFLSNAFYFFPAKLPVQVSLRVFGGRG